MRQGQHKNRSRNRGRRPGNSVNRVYESNGPDVKVRGTAQTVADKYLQLARDAASSGDIVKAESFYQHAEHYLRIVAASLPAGQQGQQRRSMYDDDNYEDGDEGDGGGDDGPEMRHQQASHDAGSEQGDDTDAEPRPQPQAQPQPQIQPQPQPVRESENEDDGGNGWDGHQPDFLRRSGQSNGSPAASPRPRRERRPRQRQPQPQPELAGSEQPQIPAAPAEDGENTGDNS